MVLVGAILLLCSLLFGPFPCSADEVWSDDFNDGDYDGWTVIAGDFSVYNNTLQAKGDLSCIIHPSPVTTGTWSFDVYQRTWEREPAIWFMMDIESVPVIRLRVEELDPNIEEIGMTETVFEGCTGYVLKPYDDGIDMALASGEQFVDCGSGGDSMGEGWNHIDVTRNSDGRICIYLNGELALDEVETAGGTTSNYFVILMMQPAHEWFIDNVVVSDTIDIEPPSPETSSPETPFYMQTWFLAAVGVVVIAVVVGAVWMLSRKAR